MAPFTAHTVSNVKRPPIPGGGGHFATTRKAGGGHPMGGWLRRVAIVLALLNLPMPEVSHAAEGTIKPNGRSFVVGVGEDVHLEDINGDRHQLKVEVLHQDQDTVYITFQERYQAWKWKDYAEMADGKCMVILAAIMNGLKKGGSFRFWCEIQSAKESNRLLPEEKEPLLSPKDLLGGLLVSLLAAVVVYFSRQIGKWLSIWWKRYLDAEDKLTCCWV